MTTVKMWSSFSSNNSSSYHLVARFTEAARAEEVARELRQLLGELPNAPEQLSTVAGFEWDWSFPYRAGDPKARCSGCNVEQTLRYVAPQRYGVDAEQLACPRCGAMFTLASLT